ncbi:hypothetical protein AAW12_08805 [Sphingobacterium sp. Ag1]|uniref:hypothetical protein n=1 Tax=Sphingobacterium sp. Ag1 TaxID=1643451 RepID=UPI0006278C84|nr:hypothetical protein [Sphingobacterium sp. Ag1]KKO91751.1 hypothetical protein AAW12_08805 [Sphingobacterium sp. Ag1]
MQDNPYVKSKISYLVAGLKELYGLTDYEALDIALKIERNEILEKSFVLTNSTYNPSTLEELIITIRDKKA